MNTIRVQAKTLKQIPIVAVVFLTHFWFNSLSVQGQSVDMLTGRLEMSIPLGKLEANDISIPISVYHSGGSLRVAEGEGDCGLGWNLSAGGGITRNVKGLPDEINTSSKKGWLYVHSTDNKRNAERIQSFVPSSDDALGGSCDDELADWNFLQTHLDSAYVNDTEPDIFFIDAPGLSAKFVFDALGVPQLLSSQDVTIIPNLPTGFIVKANNGLVYNFAYQGDRLDRKSFISKISNRVPTECLFYKKYGAGALTSFAVKWNLTSLTSSRTGTTASLDYLPALLQGASRAYSSVDSLHYMHDVYYETKLSKITLKSLSATFQWAGNLIGVKIEESNSLKSNEISFGYLSATNAVSQTSKSILRGINFSGGNCLPVENYSFDYFDVNFALETNNIPNYINWRKNWQQDYFGFPNVSVTPNRNLPQLYFYYSANNENRLRVDGITPGWFKLLPGHDRSTFSVLFFGALKKITYPTGGVTEIEYEKRFYFDPSVNSELFGGGVRVKKISTNGGEAAFGKTIGTTSPYRSIIKEYDYSDASGLVSSGRLLSPIKLGYILHDSIKQVVNNMGETPTILYSRVKEKITGKGFTIYEYNLPGVFPEISNGEWKATRTRIVRKPRVPCLNGGYLATGYYLYPYPPSSNYEFRRGRLTRTATYSESGSMISERTNTYTTLTKNPSIIKGLRFEKMVDFYHFGVYEILTGRTDVISQEVIKEASQEDPTKLLQRTISYTYSPSNMLRSVTTSLPNGTVTSKSMSYARDFVFTTPAPTDTAAVALKALNTANRGTEPVEEINYLTLPGTTQTVTSANLIIYRDFGNGLVLPYYTKSSPPGAVLTPAFANTETSFVADGDYKITPTMTFKEYDLEGRVVTQLDDKRNWSAVHYAKDLSVPIATLSNAKAQQCIVENFEMPNSFGLSKSDQNFHVSPGWTGDKAITFINSTSKLLSSPTQPIQKNGNRYRISCWLYGLQNKQIIFKAKVGTSDVASLVFTNQVSNKWNYMEGEMNTSPITGAFTLEVTTNATFSEKVSVDDIVFAPAISRIALQTVHPFNGVTSTTDDLGNSTKIAFDQSGRKTVTLDRFRNLVQKNEYAIKNQFAPEPIPSFMPNVDVDQFFVGSPVIFTPSWPADPCDASTSYSWEVDGIGQPSGSNNTLTFSFATVGRHNIKLTVTNSSGISRSYTDTICVQYNFSNTYSVVTFDQYGNPRSSYTCAEPNVQIFQDLVGPPLPAGCVLQVKWTEQVNATATTTVTTFIANYYIDCSAYQECLFPRTEGGVGTASASVTYIHLEVCP